MAPATSAFTSLSSTSRMRAQTSTPSPAWFLPPRSNGNDVRLAPWLETGPRNRRPSRSRACWKAKSRRPATAAISCAIVSPSPVPCWLPSIRAPTCWKGREDQLLVRFADTDARIAHFEMHLARPMTDPDAQLDPALLRELDRVAQHVMQDLPQAGGIAADPRGGIDLAIEGKRQALLSGAKRIDVRDPFDLGSQIERDTAAFASAPIQRVKRRSGQ